MIRRINIRIIMRQFPGSYVFLKTIQSSFVPLFPRVDFVPGISSKLSPILCTIKLRFRRLTWFSSHSLFKPFIAFPGYCVEGTLAKAILSDPEEITTMTGQKLPLKMSVDYISFSAHTDYQQTSEFIRALRPPQVVRLGEFTNN